MFCGYLYGSWKSQFLTLIYHVAYFITYIIITKQISSWSAMYQLISIN